MKIMRKLRHEEIPRPAPAAVAELPRHPISVVLENVRSIHNVGSVFRTSDAARIEHLYLTGITGTPANRRLHKTALGAQDTVPWSHHEDPAALLQKLRAEGYTLAVLEITDQPTPVADVSLDQYPMCLLIGNELNGISDALVGQADLAFEVEQYGAKQSLNVAVAYGIAAFDLVRRYRQLARVPPPH